MNEVYFGDNLEIMKQMKSESFDLVYLDPPFNTGKIQKRTNITVSANVMGDRIGFGNKKYSIQERGSTEYSDWMQPHEYLEFLKDRVIEIYRLLKPKGTMYLHLDENMVHYVKVFIGDYIFGRDCFLNEIIWAYDFGGRGNKTWPKKHDTILVYAKDIDIVYFDLDASDKIAYLSPSLVGAEKAERGKFPTDVWWMSIEGTNSKHRLFPYSTMKPYKLLERIISVSCPENGRILDPFAGSGMTGRVAYDLNRNFTLIDNNPESINVIKQYFDQSVINFIDRT